MTSWYYTFVNTSAVCILINLEVSKMARIQEATTTPDFTLTDTQGQSVTLSDYQGDKHIVLVFNRGFM